MTTDPQPTIPEPEPDMITIRRPNLVPVVTREQVCNAIQALGIDPKTVAELTIRPSEVIVLQFARNADGHRMLNGGPYTSNGYEKRVVNFSIADRRGRSA